MSLSLKISLFIALIALALSTVVTGINYFVQAENDRIESESLVTELTKNQASSAAIAAYLLDNQFALQIVEQLNDNALISYAELSAYDQSLAASGQTTQGRNTILVDLVHPFDATETIGEISVEVDLNLVSQLSARKSIQTALISFGLSGLIAIFVGVFINKKLTNPLRELFNAIDSLDTGKPEDMQHINIHHRRNDEIGNLVLKTNALITEIKSKFISEKVLRKTTEKLQKRYRLLFEQSTAGIALISNENEITAANPSFKSLFPQNQSSRNFTKLFDHPAEVAGHLKALRVSNHDSHVAVDLKSTANGNTRYLHCLFSSILDSREKPRDDAHNFIEVIAYDVTKRREQELIARFEADHDALTGILNRRAGLVNLQKQYNSAIASERLFVLMMIDLDNFKPVNDTHGHDAGDTVLRVISARIKELLEDMESNSVRWGGDEFLVAVTIDGNRSISDLAQNLLEVIQEDIYLNVATAIQVGASIGIIRTVQNVPQSVEELIGKADELMYSMKSAGRNKFQISTVF